MATMAVLCQAKNIYVAPNGSDSNAGNIGTPLATFGAAYNKVAAGDTVYFRGGTYAIQESEIMSYEENGLYACVFHIQKSGTASKRTVYAGYPGERPVFDFSNVKPSGKRIAAFYIHGNYIHLKNFDVVGVQVTITTHTQSEAITIRRGNSYNLVENVAVHDGMAIGFVVWRGSNNLFLNCDAYNNYDSVSESGSGENTDGFGCHARAQDTGNVFRSCRAWWNSDDGFDLISNLAPVTFDNCWAFYNGFKPNTYTKAANGNGFKAGGYGLSVQSAAVAAPMNTINNCIAYRNRTNGFYSNHHLTGDYWYNNTAYSNGVNYDMRNQKSWDVATDVEGYDHVLKNNIAFGTTTYKMLNSSACVIENNSFLPTAMTVTATDFENTSNPEQLMSERQSDGSLPELTFLKLKSANPLYTAKMGYQFDRNDVSSNIPHLTAADSPTDLPADSPVSTSLSYYTLQGVRVTTPVHGIYMHQGKKVVVQ